MEELRVRLHNSTRILRYFLFLIGITDSSSLGKWHWIKKLWKGFCYLIALQAHVYIFIERSYHYLDFSFIVGLDALMAITGRLTRLIGCMLIHSWLLLKFDETSVSLSFNLDTVDKLLNRPSLASLRIYTAVGTAWIFLLNNAMTILVVYSEMNSRKIKWIPWMNFVNQFIRVETQMYCTASAVIFVVLGQVLIVFYKATASSRLDLTSVLTLHRQIFKAADYLMNCFYPVLLINCAHIFFSLIFASQSFFSDIFNDFKMTGLTVWDGLWIVECLGRLWLICSTADSIRQSAAESIKYLREMRDITLNHDECHLKRHKITLAIVEISKLKLDFNLFGFVTLSRRLILKMLGTLMTILVVCFQLGLKGWKLERKIFKTY